jgi:outer membrane protein assembly factor BamA
MRLLIQLIFCLITAWCALIPDYTWAQQRNEFVLEIVSNDQKLPVEILRKLSFNDMEERYQGLRQLQNEMFRKGYLSFSVDSISEYDKTWRVSVHTGNQLQWAQLGQGNVSGDILGSVKFRDKIFYNKDLNPRQMSSLFESILIHCENHGYPFARVGLDSVKITDNQISATLNLDKGPLVRIDSVNVIGTSKTKAVYFQNYLHIKPGDLYNEQNVQRADRLLNDLAFVNPFRPVEVVFGQKQTKMSLFLNERKASKFDGIIGIQPDELTGRVSVTGDIKLAVQNAFKQGEQIRLNWRRLQTATQDIRVGFNYPYLLNTPLAADLSFMLYRRDTSFVQVNGQLGVSYLFSGTNFIKVYFEPAQSNVISRSFTPSDGLANASVNMVGTEINLINLDYRLNPSRGYRFRISGAAGNRTIRKNPDFDEAIYEDINLSTVQWNGVLDAGVFIPLASRHTLLVATKGAILQSENMFINEVYRIGGMQTIRGFDEESVFASAYNIFTLEYRFLLEKNSNIFAFFDGAWYENNVQSSYVRDTPFGFGAGISFETGAGIFSLTYALGRQLNNPVQLRGGKIHFGFINFF